MKCNSCGAELAPNATFCTNCGATAEAASNHSSGSYTPPVQTPVQSQYQQQYQQSNYQQPYYSNNNEPVIPPEYQPISMWGYFGYQLLFAIPCIGFIILIIFSFGGTNNINLKNYARSYFCLFIIGIILTILCYVFIFAIAGASYVSYL